MVNRSGESGCIKKAQGLLAAWGIWQRACRSGYRIGYPASVAFIHAGEDREEHINISNPEAERIDKLVCSLKHTSPAIYRSLIAWYVYQMSIIEAAKYCRCCERLFRSHRSYGEHFIAGAIIVCNLEKSA